MVRNLVVAGVVGLVAAACHDLPDVADGVCGNLVVDADEDCDGFSVFGGDTQCGGADDGEAACFYTCDPAPNAEIACPQGWGCGHDGICRRPSGTFEPAASSPWHMPVDAFAIGDVDGDGKADLVGNDTSNITVRFGSASADFPDEVTSKIRRPTGEVTYGHFDDDGLLDAIVPIDLGLFVLRGDPSRELEPFSYAPFTDDSKAELHAIDDPTIPNGTVLVVDRAAEAMLIMGSANVVQTPPAPATGEALILPPPTADLNDDGRREFLMAHQGGDAVYLYSSTSLGGPKVDGEIINPAESGLVQVQTVALPEGWVIAQGSHFANVDGEGGLDILISVTNGAERFLAVSYLVAGNYTSPVPVPAFNQLYSSTAGANLPLIARDFNNDEMADYATETGIYFSHADAPGQGVAPAEFFLVGTSLPDLWSDAVSGDFNGDGKPDLAVTRYDWVNQRVLSGVDIFLNSQATFFNRFHVDAEVPPKGERSLVRGDFDGDLIDDFAFLSEALDEQGGSVWAGFGSADGQFAEAQRMGGFARLDHMTVGNLAVSLGSIDGMTDVLVVSDDGAGVAISVMFGDSSRRLVAPLVLDAELASGGTVAAPQIPQRALIGDFDRDGTRDLLAVASDELFENDRETSYVWFVPGQGGKGNVDIQGAVFSEFQQDQFNVRCSTWTVVDLEASYDITQGADELIGLDDSSACRGLPDSSADPELVVMHVSPEDAMPFSVHHAPLQGDLLFPDHITSEDLDGDGDLDPVVLFSGYENYDSTEQVTYSSSGVGLLWNQDGVPMDSGYTELVLPAGVRPLKVAPISIDQDGSMDLLVLASDGIYQSLFDSDTGTFGDPVLIAPVADGRLLDVGDVNGDGLADIAVVYGKNIEVRLAVPAPPLGQGDIRELPAAAAEVSE